MFVIDMVNSDSMSVDRRFATEQEVVQYDLTQLPVDRRFATEQEAIQYALTQLPSDDYAYIVVEEGAGDEDGGRYTCIVFQGQVWWP